MSDHQHVVPLNDAIQHDTSGEPCVCGPTTELVSGPDGDSYVVTHHSLDGREGAEHWRGVSERIIRDNLPWKCEGCGTTDASRRYDNGEACNECVWRSFAEHG